MLLPASAVAYWMTALRYPQVPGSPTFTLAWTIFLESRVPDPCWAVRSHSKGRSFLSIRPRTRSASKWLVGTWHGMSLVSCTGYAVLTLMRVGFCRPGSSRPGGGVPCTRSRSSF